MFSLIFSGGISIFGLFSVNPALFCFVLLFSLFAILNLIEYKRID
jgi:hypothetical protein